MCFRRLKNLQLLYPAAVYFFSSVRSLILYLNVLLSSIKESPMSNFVFKNFLLFKRLPLRHLMSSLDRTHESIYAHKKNSNNQFNLYKKSINRSAYLRSEQFNSEFALSIKNKIPNPHMLAQLNLSL